jgi:hypothetical protein
MKAARSQQAAAVAAVAVVVALWGACASTGPKRKAIGDPCTSTREDCGYGLECRVPMENEPKPMLPDGGPLPAVATSSTPTATPAGLQATAPDAGPVKRCQYAIYAECSSEPGGPQCLSGQKCRDGHCTVMCSIDAECGEGGLCRIGLCQKKRSALTQCYDNRDCSWPDTCFHGQCVTRTDAFRCQTDLDCGYGYRCLNGRCQ